MRQRLGVILLGAGLGLFFTALTLVPVAADHVPEPVAAVTDVRFNVLNYATQTPAPCDGSEFFFDKVRLQPLVDVAGAPSEHWDVQVQGEPLVPDPKTGQFVRSDDVPWTSLGWRHQNVPPHSRLNKVLLFDTQSNSYNLTPGLWRFTLILTTDVSQRTFVRTCEFVVVE